MTSIPYGFRLHTPWNECSRVGDDISNSREQARVTLTIMTGRFCEQSVESSVRPYTVSSQSHPSTLSTIASRLMLEATRTLAKFALPIGGIGKAPIEASSEQHSYSECSVAAGANLFHDSLQLVALLVMHASVNCSHTWTSAGARPRDLMLARKFHFVVRHLRRRRL